MNRNADNAAGIHDLTGHLDILGTGFGISARVIMEKDNARRRFQDRRAEDLSGMDERTVQYPGGNGDFPQQVVGAIEKQNHEHFVMKVLHKRLESSDDVLRRGNPAAEIGAPSRR